MSALSLTPRLGILAMTGITALSVAALSSAAPAHAEGDRVLGTIASVSGDTFEVTHPNGTTTVHFAGSTTISEAIPAQFSEVTVGSCVKAGPTPESTPVESGAITAKWVLISPAVDGKCPPRPASTPTPPPGAPASHRGVRGVVNSVTGDTISVTRIDADGHPIPVTVNVNDATHYRKRVPANAQAITAGKCAAVRGDDDANGVLQASRVTVWVATDGHCPQPGA